MDSNYFVYAALFILFAILSAFFSGTETAFFSLSEVELTKLRERGGAASERIVRLMEEPRRFLISILTGNMVVNIGAATVATLFITNLSHDLHFSEDWGIFIEVVLVTLFILIFSEVTPKVVAVKNAEKFAMRVSLPIELIYIVLLPVSTALKYVADVATKLFRVKSAKYSISEEEIKALVGLGEEKGALEEDEREMIDSIFEFGETTVGEIMVPRVDMVCIDMQTSLEELVRLIREEGHTRIPLYEDRIDNIKGVIHAKDLISLLDKPEEMVDLSTLARAAYFVPESKKIDELLREFQKEKMHMAIVVDEYGGTAGLVTLEDVLEEIVGEIQDEYDREQPIFHRIDENTIRVDAKINIHELNEILEESLPESEDYDTLGGLILNITGNVPQENEMIQYHDYDFIVEQIEGQRIGMVRIVYRKREERITE